MIDSHCHLADPKFNDDLDAVLTRAIDVGVDRFVCIADTLEEVEKCLALGEKYDHIYYTAGIHPHASREWIMGNGKRIISDHAKHPKMVAVGEIGLDYHYMNSPKEDQIRALREQIQIANELGLPVVLHNRESFEDLLPILQDLKPEKAVLHCCTESWDNAKKILDMGYLLGFTAIATYPKSQAIREVIKQCPLEQMMIETDAPYLAPEGFRGKRCEPAYVTEVAKCIAETKQIPLEEVAEITTKNTEEFYGL